MVEVKTLKNYLVKDETKDGYCFKSRTNQVLTQEELAKEVSKFNSTVTEADAKGMLTIEDFIICEHLRKGYLVELPWCYAYLRANGTTDNANGVFSPGAGNHKFNIILEVKPEARGKILKDVEYIQVSSDFLGDPKIKELFVVNDILQAQKVTSFEAGSTMRLHGHNLKVDLTDEEQGVFLVQNKTEIRLTKYARAGTCLIDVVIPQSVTPGSYFVKVVTRPGSNRTADDTYPSEITITA